MGGSGKKIWFGPGRLRARLSPLRRCSLGRRAFAALIGGARFAAAGPPHPPPSSPSHAELSDGLIVILLGVFITVILLLGYKNFWLSVLRLLEQPVAGCVELS